jgi:hypothetical protein
VPGSPQFKEKNKEKETFQKQSAMLEEVVKLPLPLVWHGFSSQTMGTKAWEARNLVVHAGPEVWFRGDSLITGRTN